MIYAIISLKVFSERGRIMNRSEKIEKTVEWLREKVKEANCKGLVV